MLSYVIVGSGYRSQYFARVARRYPGLFRALYLCRSMEKATWIEEQTGVKATTSAEECEAFHPDFIVIAVDRGHVADETIKWAEKGYSVVTETPAGDTLEKLEALWKLKKEMNARIVCCEQYHRQPLLAAGLKAVRDGVIGTPSSAYLSFLHDYHAASLMRRMLLTQPGEAYTLRGMRLPNPVTETDSRGGAIMDGRVKQALRDMLVVSFASGKTAVYDFESVQYRSYIRSRHLTVRGDRGEWTDNLILALDKENRPIRQYLTPEIPEAYRCLDTQELRDRRRAWQAELAPDTVQDEYAIAAMLLDMESYLSGGASPYPLEEALDDAYFWLLAQEAVKTPWQEIVSRNMIWHQ